MCIMKKAKKVIPYLLFLSKSMYNIYTAVYSF